MTHLLSVAALVLEDGGTEDEAIAGLLHDVLEDIGMDMRDEIRERFGARVEEIVLGCTDSDRRLDEDSWTRKMKAVAHLSDASPEVLRVSLADKLHNARSILRDLEQVGAAVWQRFNVGREIVHRGEKVSVSWRQARNCLELLTAVADAVDLLAEGAMAP